VIGLQVESYFVDNFEYLRFVGWSVGQVPEQVKRLDTHFFFLYQKLKDVIAALNELDVGFVGVPDCREDLLLSHPIDQSLSAHRRAGGASLHRVFPEH
jgi:hypothetical protein